MSTGSSENIGKYRQRTWDTRSDSLSKNVKKRLGIVLHPITEDVNGRTPIYWAARKGHRNIVEMLLASTDNPNTPDNNGCTPIHWAAYKGYLQIMAILIYNLVIIKFVGIFLGTSL